MNAACLSESSSLGTECCDWPREEVEDRARRPQDGVRLAGTSCLSYEHVSWFHPKGSMRSTEPKWLLMSQWVRMVPSTHPCSQAALDWSSLLRVCNHDLWPLWWCSAQSCPPSKSVGGRVGVLGGGIGRGGGIGLVLVGRGLPAPPPPPSLSALSAGIGGGGGGRRGSDMEPWW